MTFWEELAHVAYQHVEKGQQIYVSGRLVSDTVESDDGKQQTYYKVSTQQSYGFYLYAISFFVCSKRILHCTMFVRLSFSK